MTWKEFSVGDGASAFTMADVWASTMTVVQFGVHSRPTRHDLVAWRSETSGRLVHPRREEFTVGEAQREQFATVAANSLTLQFLAWLAAAPRTYADVMQTWPSSCPRLLIWEDALAADMISIERLTGKAYRQSIVSVTPRGRAILEAAAASPPLHLNGDRRGCNADARRDPIH